MHWRREAAGNSVELRLDRCGEDDDFFAREVCIVTRVFVVAFVFSTHLTR